MAFHEAMQPSFKDYARQIIANAKVLAAEMAEQGFRVVTGGTDNHMFLVDVFREGVTGKDAQILLDSVNITTNKNTIPWDPNPPMVASGLRLGTPALTTRGMKEPEMKQVARLIAEALRNRADQATLDKVKKNVLELCDAFPLYAARRAEGPED